MSNYDETVFEIWRISEKRCYYLMSAAGAGIGYSIATIDADISILDSRILLASLGCWALSFFSGLATLGNLKIVIGGFVVAPHDFAKFQAKGGEELNEYINSVDQLSAQLGARSKLHHLMQVLFLSLGALFLIGTKIDILITLGLTP